MLDDIRNPGEHPDPFQIAPIAEEIWELKYRFSGDGTGKRQKPDQSITDTWDRVARAMAGAETGARADRQHWHEAFYSSIADFGFLPAGRILAGAGARRSVTLFNCFVMADLADDLAAIFDGVREAALTMQQGGGIGQDFSCLRPRGALVRSIGAEASGPVSFMDVWDAMCQSLISAGSRRGAMMGTLRCDHPDIEEFVAAKREQARLRNFNLSVLVTDAFVEAVRKDAPWSLIFDGKVYRTVPARGLWDRIMAATYDYAEPGVIFIDRINAQNNLAYCETIRATNPCGEQPLPPNGACLLGSINLARLVTRPFSPRAGIDTGKLEERVRVAVRLLDNAIDVSRMPLPAQKLEARAKRRIGLGITGLADALIFCGLRYGEDKACRQAGEWMRAIQRACYMASAELAAEKGSFPMFDAGKMLDRPALRRLEPDVRAQIERHGLRNGCLTSIAPTGTISLLAGNVSSGVEPVFALSYMRGVRESDGKVHQQRVEDYAVALHRRMFGNSARLPDAFVTVGDLTPGDHLAMQAALQPHVDSSISKTINCPADIPFQSFKDIYLDAYELGLKGCTTYRPNAVTGAVLTVDESLVEPVIADGAGGHPGGMLEAGVPLAREPVLAGYTYKLKWPASDHAIYVTINDIEHDGRRRPFEIFINTKNLEHYAWTVALTRMISAVFRRGGDVSFVVEELKAVFDPQGGQWMQGHYVPSLLAAIGEIIEGHMVRTGFLPAGATVTDDGKQAPDGGVGLGDGAALRLAGPDGPGRAGTTPGQAQGRGCMRCGRRELFRHEGCWVCHACGYSRC